MNLKTFHFVFLIASALMAFLFAGWEFANHTPGQNGPVLGAVASAVIGVGLVIYAIRFLKKTRKLVL
ncbi:MAG: hypothetical protein QM796_09380 [Chthoniobacteraceae bacterium]